MLDRGWVLTRGIKVPRSSAAEQPDQDAFQLLSGGRVGGLTVEPPGIAVNDCAGGALTFAIMYWLLQVHGAFSNTVATTPSLQT